MNTARSSYSLFRVIQIALVVLISSAALVVPKTTWAAAGNTQVCNPGKTCAIGEFMYDDSYNPLTTASCSLTSRYPNGTVYLNSVAATVSGEGDAWYSYEFTTPSTTGLYRTELRCDVEGEEMALDKSFEVKSDASSLSADDIAAATWSYSNRTLTSFGSLVQSIWESANRTLTGVGLSSGSLATKSDVDNVANTASSISSQVNAMNTTLNSVQSQVATNTNTTTNNTILVDQLVNGIKYKTTLEYKDDSDQGLSTKAVKSKETAMVLGKSVEHVHTKAALADSKWDKMKLNELVSVLKSIDGVVGKESDSLARGSIQATSNYLFKQWGWEEAEDVRDEAQTMSRLVNSLIVNLEKNGKTSSSRAQLKGIVTASNEMSKAVGGSNSEAGDKNIFGRIANTQQLSNAFDKNYRELSAVIPKLKENNKANRRAVNDAVVKVAKINLIPLEKSEIAVVTERDTEREMKNKAFGLLGLITANKQLLAQDGNKAFASTWLELGSIVFKTIVTNPSDSLTQEVPFKYALPEEIKEEDVKEVDEGLTVEFNVEENRYYLVGDFELGPGESKTLSVTVDDKVFAVSDREIDSIRKQAEDLMGPLKDTSYFAQGVTLKSDIDVSLDKAITLREAAVTPEQKIRAYREGMIEIESSRAKIESMKELVTSAGSVGTMFGFIGGAQTMAVWGIIIVIIAGFVFMTLYMRQLRMQDMKRSKSMMSSLPKGEGVPVKKDVEEGRVVHKSKSSAKKRIKIAVMIVGTFAVLGGALGGVSMVNEAGRKALAAGDKSSAQVEEVLGEKVEDVHTDEEVVVREGDPVSIYVPEGVVVGVYSEPRITAEEVVSLDETSEAKKLSEKDGWIEVGVQVGRKEVYGWVDGDFVEYDDLEDEDEVVGGGTVVIYDDLTGDVRVRATPGNGKVIGKVYAGDSLTLLSSEGGWFEVELEDGAVGWVSEEYAQVESLTDSVEKTVRRR